MTDVNKIARSYIDLWNERTPSRRREILSQNWTSDARYVDPLMSGDGHDGVDALIAGVQQRFPDFRGRDASYLAPPAQIRTGPIRAYGSHLGCLTAKRLSGHG